MKSESDFTKPLKPTTSRGRISVKQGVLIALGIAFVFFVPIFSFYEGFTRVASFFEDDRPEREIVFVEKPDEPQKADEELKPTVRQETDNERVEREGNVIRIRPETPSATPQPAPRRQKTALAHLPDPELIERGATGVIPRKSPDGLRPMDVYSRQPDTEGNFGVARVVLVIGGLGISQTSTQEAIQNLPPNVTLAFAPYGNSLSRWMQQARKSGHELLLQVPMEPIDYPSNNPGQHTIRSSADLQENLANLHWIMSRITNYVGITNYLGNKIMAEPAALSPIFDEVAERGLLFFEDGSVQNSLAEGVALKSLLPYAKGEILLDNVRSRAAINEKLQKLAEQAKRTGLAVGVGNAFPDTIDLVAAFARRAKQNGIEITPVSAIVRDPAR